jgi:cytochrome b561
MTAMTISGGTSRYSGTAMALHWVLALVLVATFCVGIYMVDLKLSPTRIRLFNWHKWAGISFFAFSIFRLGWRLSHRPPAPPASTSHFQIRLAEGVHRILYVMSFLVPLIGWAYSSAAGFPVVLFGRLPLPDFVPVDKTLAHNLQNLHAIVAYCFAALAGLHVAAAFGHHFIKRDDILRRMLPGRSRTLATQSAQKVLRVAKN